VYAIALTTTIYSALHPVTVGYQRDIWLRRDRTPPEGNGLLAAALINPRHRVSVERAGPAFR